MPEEMIESIFAEAIVEAGFREGDEGAAFAWLDFFSQTAAGVYGVS